MYKYLAIDLIGRVFTNSPGDQGSVPGQVIPETEKMVFDTSWLNTLHYMEQINVNWSNLGKGIALSPALWCSSY